MTPAIPTLETARLVLAGPGVGDFADSFAMWREAAVFRHISGRASTAEEAWQRLLRYAGHWALLGFGFWTLREKATGRFVGEAGLADFHRDIDPPLDAPEAGWVLVPSMHGRGYALEAMAAVLAWGEANLAMTRTLAMITPDNAASLRVAGKLGFRELRRGTFKGDSVVIVERCV